MLVSPRSQPIIKYFVVNLCTYRYIVKYTSGFATWDIYSGLRGNLDNYTLLSWLLRMSGIALYGI